MHQAARPLRSHALRPPARLECKRAAACVICGKCVAQRAVRAMPWLPVPAAIPPLGIDRSRIRDVRKRQLVSGVGSGACKAAEAVDAPIALTWRRRSVYLMGATLVTRGALCSKVVLCRGCALAAKALFVPRNQPCRSAIQ